jgi:hypothetical protein
VRHTTKQSLTHAALSKLNGKVMSENRITIRFWAYPKMLYKPNNGSLPSLAMNNPPQQSFEAEEKMKQINEP